MQGMSGQRVVLPVTDFEVVPCIRFRCPFCEQRITTISGVASVRCRNDECRASIFIEWKSPVETSIVSMRSIKPRDSYTRRDSSLTKLEQNREYMRIRRQDPEYRKAALQRRKERFLALPLEEQEAIRKQQREQQKQRDAKRRKKKSNLV